MTVKDLVLSDNFAVPSAAAYYNTMFSMMEAFDWSRVYIIAGTPGTHYFHNFHVQWNLSNQDTLGAKKIVLIREVSSFQGL